MDINFRKFITPLTLIVLLFYKSSFSQYNLIENPNFELGNPNNRNIYCVYTSTSDFTSDLSDWSHINVGNNSITFPHWIVLSLDSCQNLCKAVGTPIDYLIFPPVATG